MKLNKIFIISVMFLFAATFSGQTVFGYGGPPVQSSSNNYTVEIYSENESYMLGDTVTFTGNVNKYDEDRTLRITVFDTTDRYVLTQKTSVETDGTFSHDITLNKKFSEGKFIVKAQYGDTNTTVKIISFMISSDDAASSQDNEIPEWIKSNAGWWAEGSIDDGSFVQGIQFLIKEGLMKISATEQGSSSQDNEIPEWIKSNAGWWAEGSIDDGSFVQGIQFLIKEGLMKISN